VNPGVSVRVYKLGGPALEQADLLAPLAAEVKRAPGPVLIVHGGGRSVERALTARGLESKFVDGRRATSEEAMDVVEGVLSGQVNKALVAGLVRCGVPAVGLSGRDGALVTARTEAALGRVGTPETVRPDVLRALWAASLVPVVSPVSSDLSGRALNVNADEAALALARAVGATSLVYLSDVDGVRLDGRTVDVLEAGHAARRIADGAIAGGMALKVNTALEAAAAGIEEVVIAGVARLQGTFAGTRVGGRAPAGAEAGR
jgi:acetylglutamate kinase